MLTEAASVPVPPGSRAPEAAGHPRSVHSHAAHSDAAHSHAHPVLDRIGVGVSLTCAIHCALTALLSLVPTVASGLGATGVGLEMLEWADLPLLGIALVVGLFALVPAYRREHQRPAPIALFVTGIAIIALAHTTHEEAIHAAVTVLGVLAVATAHLLNIRFTSAAHPH